MENNESLYFNIDLPQLIIEIGNNVPQASVFRQPLKVLQAKLAAIASRAIELDDPELNILMLECKLYDVCHDDIQKYISEQKQRQ